MKQMQQEMVLVKESVQRIETEVQEANIMLRDLLREIQRHREE
jgi:hypothetical protein